MASLATNSDTEELSGPETGHATKDPRLPSDLSGLEENNELDLDDDHEWNDHSEELERVEESPKKKSQSKSPKNSHSRQKSVEELPKKLHSRQKTVEESAKKMKLEVVEMIDDNEEEDEGKGLQEPAIKKKLVEASGDEAEEARPVPKRRVGCSRIHPPKQGPSKPRGRRRKNPATQPPLPSKKYRSKSAAISAPSVLPTLAGPLTPFVSLNPASSSGVLSVNTWAPTLMTFPIHRPPDSETWVTAPPLASSCAVNSKPPDMDPAPIHAAYAPSSHSAARSSSKAIAVAGSALIPVAATSSAPSIASSFAVGQAPIPAAATATSLLSVPLGAPNKASVDRNIVEPHLFFPLHVDLPRLELVKLMFRLLLIRSVKRAKELAVERNLTHLLPWITHRAFPAGLSNDNISHRLTPSNTAFKNAARKKAEEEAARRKAKEETACKKAEEEAACKRPRRKPPAKRPSRKPRARRLRRMSNS
ncbi:hypothetical protein BDK51DRAFT_50894 [Blyttiomyces helicus]|uniref:Uncharacterized protein n=1 Tax=Blyttiomyces helicus TaxID=388810 RepID=A0A4P9WM12_9FUNG|nr:hypothetical protein BDK51DRAFT_50894 [Blyttiomyces helicus]|eukprot:RKO93482.1 hypothetical protein BDK51DRAFT_50894 [Blyttiomyces helicus]